MKKAIIVGCGLSGSVIARFMAEQLGYQVSVFERRNHIGGNMYDYVNEDGILVHKYGPHTFHTNKKDLYDFICRYCSWVPYRLTCGAVINNKYTPTPFNFTTIEDFYDPLDAKEIIKAIQSEYPMQDSATVLELLNNDNSLIRNYAKFLFENDYKPYTAKQWGLSPDEIDPQVLQRVPIRFSYHEGYFDDKYEVMPLVSYENFFQNLLSHKNIDVYLGVEALNLINADITTGTILFNNSEWTNPIIFTGALDELFNYQYGKLPYRSLRFEWKSEAIKSFQPAPVVAYPQAKDYTRITEYTKLPFQEVGDRTTYALEYSIPNTENINLEPYYPIPTNENFAIYEQYCKLVATFQNLFICGRLAQYKYYNMDQALEQALILCKKLEKLK